MTLQTVTSMLPSGSANDVKLLPIMGEPICLPDYYKFAAAQHSQLRMTMLQLLNCNLRFGSQSPCRIPTTLDDNDDDDDEYWTTKTNL